MKPIPFHSVWMTANKMIYSMYDAEYWTLNTMYVRCERICDSRIFVINSFSLDGDKHTCILAYSTIYYLIWNRKVCHRIISENIVFWFGWRRRSIWSNKKIVLVTKFIYLHIALAQPNNKKMCCIHLCTLSSVWTYQSVCKCFHFGLISVERVSNWFHWAHPKRI